MKTTAAIIPTLSLHLVLPPEATDPEASHWKQSCKVINSATICEVSLFLSPISCCFERSDSLKILSCYEGVCQYSNIASNPPGLPADRAVGKTFLPADRAENLIQL